MLYSYQNSNGFLHRDTVKMIWTPVPNTNLASDKDGKYGMGWGVILSQNNYPFCKSNQFYVSHSGGAAGASSILLILPRADEAVTGDKPVRGVVVSMIANLQNVGLHRTALEIAKVFESVTD
jgi:serine beta-lactamase-like protein LACTB